MSEMVEQVAEAIEKGAEGVLTIKTCRLIALTAISSMREPTKAMLDAGGNVELASPELCFVNEGAHAVWRAMIDAALK